MLSGLRKLVRDLRASAGLRRNVRGRRQPRAGVNCAEILQARTLLSGVTTGPPDVSITRGFVASDNPVAAFDSPVGPSAVVFAPPGTDDAPFTGIITSDGIRTGATAQPLNANLTNAHAGDTVRVAIVLENRSVVGSAFDVTLRDSLPAAGAYVPGSLRIVDGLGDLLPWRDLDGAADGSGLFGNGIRLDDPGNTNGTFATAEHCGALDALTLGSPGTNIAIALYDFTILNPVGSTAVFSSDATLVQYAQTEAGSNLSTLSTDAASFTLDRADIEITKSVDNATPIIGDLVTWTVSATNDAANATSAASGVVVADLIPSGQSVVPGSAVFPGGGSFDESTGLWVVGQLISPGSTVQLTFQTTAGNGVEFTTPRIDLELTGLISNTSVSEGSAVDYQISIRNNAEAATVGATGVQVSDLLPAGLNFVSHTVSAGTFSSSTGVWDLSSITLAPGQTEEITISTTAAVGTAGTNVLLAAEVNSAGTTDVDSVTGNASTAEDDDLTATISVRAAPTTRTVSGIVFLDVNNDGTNSGEAGVPSITVNAYGPDGTLSGTAVTNASGNYSIPGVTSEAVRLEFIGLAAGQSVTTAQSPPAATNTFSSVAFLDTGSAPVTANLALYQPNAQAQYLTTCFVYSGQSTLDPNVEPAVIVFNADGSVKTVVATIAQVGATNGVALHAFSGDQFVASFQKRHSDIGPAGNSAIYRIDSAGTVSTFIRLDDFFGANSAGPYSHNPADWFTDAPAFTTVGRNSLGDVDISEDGRFLYTVNLATRELIEIQIGDGAVNTPVDYLPGDLRTIRTVPILGDDATAPTNGGIPTGSLGLDAVGNIRPFALRVQDGLVYVGMVYSAETTQNDSEMEAWVYAFDPVAGTFSSTAAASFNLDTRTLGGGWQSWTDNWGDLPKFYEPAGDYFTVGRNQPWLTDIEFDNNGDMILGFRDRTGDQVGHMVGDPTGADSDGNGSPDRFYHDTKGDILHLRRSSASGWSVEIGHVAGDGTEYYEGDAPLFDPVAATLHPEAAQGGLTLVPGFNEIVTTAIDPESFWSGGVLWLDNATGAQTDALDIYSGSEVPDITTFGKNNGLGDLEFLNNLSMEIGNRIWHDADADGIQDAGESPLPNVDVQLFDVSNPLVPLFVGSTTTDADGEYYFNDSNVAYADGADPVGLRPLTRYEIRVVSSEFGASGTLNQFLATAADSHPVLVGATLQPVTGAAEFDSDLDGTADTARNQRIDVLTPVGLAADGVRVVISNMTGGFARVASDQSVIFEFEDGSEAGSFEYSIVDDRIDSDGVGFDDDADGVTDRAVIPFETDASGTTDHSLDFGFVRGRADLELDKLAERKIAVEGESVSFRLMLTNNAQSATLPASGVTVADSIPSGLTLVPTSIVASQGTFDGATWTLATALAPGETATLIYQATVDAGTAGSVLINAAQVTAVNENDVDSSASNDDGDRSEDDEDDAVVLVGTLTSTTTLNTAQLVAVDQPDFDSSIRNDDHDQSEDDEAAASYTLSTVTNVFDFGDLPDVYQTLSASGGPSHRRGTATFLGASIDDELDGQPSSTADGDGADDDGVRFLSPLLPGTSASIEITGSTSGYLNAWIDFDADGVLDELSITTIDGVSLGAPATAADLLLSAGSHVLSIDVPTTATGQMAARFRFTNDAMAGSRSPGGQWLNGEVEDYMLKQIGDRVWFDHDADGTLDAVTEAGLSGVTVVLSADLDGDGSAETWPTTTDSDGFYRFDGIPASTYSLTVTPPTSLVPTFDPDGGNDHTAAVTIGTADASRQDLDFGYRGTGLIGDTIWLDASNNGLQDAGESGISGVPVQLTGDINGDSITDITLTTASDAAGLYEFEHLVPGDYEITVTRPAGLVPTFDADSIATPDTSQTSLSFGTVNRTQDFGYRGTGIIGDLIWVDLNADGVRNTGEPPMSGVAVRLTGDTDGDTIVDVTQTATTDASGGYQFSGLSAGDYTITVTPPGGYVPTFDADGAGTANQSVVSLGAGVSNLDQDFGYRGTGLIGDTVWTDADADGVIDAGEAGIGGVQIQLLGDLNADSVPDFTLSTTTTATGTYEFTDLPPGNYTVNSAQPAGTVPTFDADGAASPGTSALTLAGGATVRNQDFGYQPASGGGGTGLIGDTVWQDTDGDGVLDAGESGISGISVQLDGDTNGDSVIDVTQTTVTNAAGVYEFSGLAAGTYTVTVARPAGTVPSFDADGTGTPDVASVVLAAGTTDRTQDFGYTNPPSTDVDLIVRKDNTNSEDLAAVGAVVTYVVSVSNAGPAAAVNATVADTLPAQFVTATWTAVGTPGTTFTASGTGSLGETVTIPVGGTITWTIAAQLNSVFTGTITNTASASSTQTDTDPSNNSAVNVTSVTPLTLTPENQPLPGEIFQVGARGMSHVSLVPFVVGTRLGTGVVNGVTVGIADPRVFMIGFVCVDDRIIGVYDIPPELDGQTLLFQAYESTPVPRLSNIITADVGGSRPVVAESGGLSAVTEGSTTDTLNVVLSQPPTANVVVNISNQSASRLAVSAASLTFSPANWNVPQTVTLQAVNDSLVNGDVAASIQFRVAAGSDPAFLTSLTETVRVLVTDDDVLSKPGVTSAFTATANQRPPVTWSAVTGADSYDVYISPVSDIGNPKYNTNVVGTTFTPPADLGVGKHAVWVRARTRGGQTSAWSAGARLDVTTAPVIGSIPDGVDRRPAISWSTVTGAAGYEIWVNNQTTGVSRVIHESSVTSSPWTPAADLGFGVHAVWMRTVNQYGETGSWSAGQSFFVSPALIAPVGPVFNSRPTFTWTVLPGAATHEIYIRTPTGVIQQAGLTSGSFTPASALPAGTQRWWIRSYAANGKPGKWSAHADVTTDGRPTILTPADSGTASNIPLFEWTSVDGAARYSLYVSRVDVPAFIFRDDTLTANSHTYTPGLASGVYRAWVRAVSTSGALSPWSVPVTFSVASSGSFDEESDAEKLTPGRSQPVLVAINKYLKHSGMPAEESLRQADTEHVVAVRLPENHLAKAVAGGDDCSVEWVDRSRVVPPADPPIEPVGQQFELQDGLADIHPEVLKAIDLLMSDGICSD